MAAVTLGAPADVRAHLRRFYHSAVLVPGDRFDAALTWLRERVDLGFWDARACYCHDPAGNIVEPIAHPVDVTIGSATEPVAADLPGAPDHRPSGAGRPSTR